MSSCVCRLQEESLVGKGVLLIDPCTRKTFNNHQS